MTIVSPSDRPVLLQTHVCPVFQHDSASMQRWSIMMTLAVFFTAIVTPVEVALYETSVNAMFWINRVVDVIFLCDIIINFRCVPVDRATVLHYLYYYFIIKIKIQCTILSRRNQGIAPTQHDRSCCTQVYVPRQQLCEGVQAQPDSVTLPARLVHPRPRQLSAVSQRQEYKTRTHLADSSYVH